jgi:LPXTG-motif cell wall-anchored protein
MGAYSLVSPLTAGSDRGPWFGFRMTRIQARHGWARMRGFPLNGRLFGVLRWGTPSKHLRWEVAVRTAVRALLLAAFLVVVPVTAAHAGVEPDDTVPYTRVTTTTKPPITTTTTRPPTTVTLVKEERPSQRLAVTGSDSTPLVWAGIAAVSIGAILVIGARRRASVRR